MTPIANNLPNHQKMQIHSSSSSSSNNNSRRHPNKLSISVAPDNEDSSEETIENHGNQTVPNSNNSSPSASYPSLIHPLTSTPSSYRSHLNHSIHRYRLLRSGAQNLIQATSNRYIRETAALELCFVNSHLQLLREQLAELNGRCWDGEKENGRENGGRSIIKMPMICLGLKETNELGRGVEEGIKDFIHVHYSEPPTPYEPSIQTFLQLRQSIRFPPHNQQGIQLLLQYLTVLYYVERRFFSSSNEKQNGIGIWFEWYDSLTGIPSLQRTVAFEKASVLFNLAAIHTQIATSILNQTPHNQQEPTSTSGGDPFDTSIDHFLRGAGTLRYIGDHFTNPPSFDLGSETLEGLIGVMVGQGRECLVEKARVGQSNNSEETPPLSPTPSLLFDLSQESAHLSTHYHSLTSAFTSSTLSPYIPPAWTALLQFKTHYYASQSNYYIAKILLQDPSSPLSKETIECFKYLYEESTDNEDNVTTDIRSPSTQSDRISLGKSHLRQSMINLEDGERCAKFSKELKSNRGILHVVNELKNQLIDLGGIGSDGEAANNGGNSDTSVLDPPKIIPSTKYQLSLSPPDLATNAEDPFKALGPLALFSAKRHWSAPRKVVLKRVGNSGHNNGFGLSIKGSAPVVIACVDEGSSAEAANLGPGDIIVGINGQDTKWSTHEEIVTLVRNAGDRIEIKVVTMLDEKGLATLNRRLSPGSSSNYSSQSEWGTTNSSSGASSSSASIPRSNKKHTSKVVPFLQRSNGHGQHHTQHHDNNNVIYR